MTVLEKKCKQEFEKAGLDISTIEETEGKISRNNKR